MKQFRPDALATAGVLLFSLVVTTLGVTKGAFAQTMKSDHWSPAELQERAKHLQQQAAEKGSASEKLEIYPHHYTMLAFRNRSGGGEVHQNYADVFFILDGRATLVTGGEVVEPKSTGPGETLGASVKGGTRQELKAGDVVHIPASMPHQMVLADGDTVTYFVVKAEETR
jgi:mannose-6-phosphate isomerase-like protein (cupin superfamily)